MNASHENRCPRCGAIVPVASTERLCPACLLSGVLNASGEQTATLTSVDESALSPSIASEFPFEFGAYRLLGLLGRGGMGTVYEAEHRETGRRLALKTLGRQLDSAEMRQRFLREGRLAARVSHPNSLYVFGCEEVDNRPVITMEIATGGTLKDRLKESGPLPVAGAVDAVLDVVAGLESALSQGVLHRDIKPSNCFVSPDGSVKVGDFGLSVSTLARTDTFVTAHGKIMGTPAYASPEQLRGDALDLRADIYSVGATLFTLLTDRAPFEGENAVQVVANAVEQRPAALTDLRDDVPAGLARVVARCLAKEPDGRYSDYAALRSALLPYSSREPEPASVPARIAAGWIDYLIALLPPYVALMLLVGGEELLVRPLVDRTLESAEFYFLLFGLGFLYFGILEGFWGAGVGKRLKGLTVRRPDGRRPGFGRAVIRVAVPLACVEGIRIPVSMAFISDMEWTGLQTAMFVIVAVVCGWVPALLALRARHENRFATIWDLASGTRVVWKPVEAVRPVAGLVEEPETPDGQAAALGPYRFVEEVVPGEWILGVDPVLRRRVWLLRRASLRLPHARRAVARAGRTRWLQRVDLDGTTWDAYEALPGVPFRSMVEDGERLPWSTLRHWLHDLALELWHAAGDSTLPAKASLDHVWITASGRAVLLDEPWPVPGPSGERFDLCDVAGQQQLLAAVASCVEPTGLPLHARPVLRNVAAGKFEKLSFLTGTLRGQLDRPADVGRGVRAGAALMLPFYIWAAVFVGRYHDKAWTDSPGEALAVSLGVVLAALALLQLLALPFRFTAGRSIFRLAVVDEHGDTASRRRLLARWAIVWLPPIFVCAFIARMVGPAAAHLPVLAVLLVWLAAAIGSVAVLRRGIEDRLAGTWLVRR